ncbi:nucleotidyltransferase family protein [Pedobacter endophyticus]|uniref:Nucleotidyltransferase family protein n=1 Tax=Pedobacter endophyticus TaxID=2789740 RepID=A0A7S9L1C2_9SPHI|nr:nucleotidyltransferase family protein [Pedobacter endophyticus]QPH40695.1 nucleotidyltransferase family protein [Pedobacter endophyticus]
MVQTGIVILAAGSSSRLGKPKQLLAIDGKTLLQRVCDAATAAQLAPIVVVLGANADKILPQDNDSQINFVVNSNWAQGMSSSITAGLKRIAAHESQVKSVIISVCDQPYISSELFTSLINKHNETKKGIIASQYGGTIGTPVLFARKYFEDLMLLTGENGAKGLITMQATDLATISFEQGNIDIDTESDYQSLLNKQHD